MRFFKNLAKQLKENGKLLMGYVLNEAVTAYPGIGTAVKDVIEQPTAQNILAVAVQGLLLFGASHRAIKLIKAAAED